MNNNERRIMRFDIFLYDFGENIGSIQNGLRPAVVIQDSRFNEKSPTVIIAALTTAVKKEHLPSHIFIGQNYGLTKPSMVLLEQVRTINQNELGTYIGHIDDISLIRTIERGIRKTFGLWNYMPKNENSIRCLCSSCVKNYMDSGSYYVRRLDPFQKEKDICEHCDKPGWDYVIVDKKEQNR